MAPRTVSCVIFIASVCIVASQITGVNYAPEVSSYNLAGRVTANTAVLQLPRCYFNGAPSLCSSLCDVYLVPAVDSGVNNFDSDKVKATILSLSPYPTAFTGSNPKNYYLTKVGPFSNYPCMVPPGVTFFRAGADGNCSTPNCNGALPTGSTVRFKYLLFNTVTQALLMETQWSGKIILYSLSNPAAIDDSMKERSGGMIVITSILSVFLALLLLFLIGLTVYACRYAPEKEPLPSLGSLRVKKYDTHNVKQPQLYVNQSYVDETKKYASLEVLPSDLKISEDLGDSVKLKRYQNYDPPGSEDKSTEKQTEQQTPQDKVYKV